MIHGGNCKSPCRIGEFLYVFFYSSHHFCVPCLFQCYALTSEVNFTLSLTFYLSSLFYIPPSTHFTPLVCFFFLLPFLAHFCVHILLSQVNLNVSILGTLVLCTVFGAVIKDLTHEEKPKPKSVSLIRLGC